LFYFLYLEKLLLFSPFLVFFHNSIAIFLILFTLVVVVQSCPTLCNPMDCSMPDFPVLHRLPELAQTHVHWISDAIQSSHPLSFPSPLAFNLSQHQVFSKESAICIRWPKYWSFSFNISLSNEYSRLISFRMDWFDLLAVQGTLKSLFQHHSSKASILWHSALFGAGGEGDDRGWDGWMVSPTRWTWVWVNSGSLWWTGRPGMLQCMGLQRPGHDWATELNWTEQPSLWSYSHFHTLLLEFTLQLKAIVWCDITATERIHVNSLSQFCLCIYVLKGYRSYKLKSNIKNEVKPNFIIYAWGYFHSW